MNYRGKRWAAFLLAGALLLSFGGCAADKDTDSPVPTAENTADNTASDELFTDRDKEIGYDESMAIAITLTDDKITCDSKLVDISGSTVTIQGEGTYLLSGSLANGQVIIDADKSDKIQLILNGVSINCDTSAAIYVKQADKVFLTLGSGSENTLSNTAEFVSIDENNIDSVIFSKDDLTLNGAGSLTVQAAYGHGIVSKDDLVITSGSYAVTAERHALSGNDSVRIAAGSFVLTAGKDGIHAENSDDSALGSVYIGGGDFSIISDGDGMDASGTLQIEGGTFHIQSGGGAQNAPKQQENFSPWGQAAEETDTISMKGIKSDGDLTINGGSFLIDSADDGIHGGGNALVQDGDITISTGDDGIHGDGNVTISGGIITVSESYEGIEGQTIDITGGTISVTASDDGLNAAGGYDESGFGFMRQDAFATDSGCYISISGGTVRVSAAGDGVDSNGNLYVSGGETYVSGPTDSANGALDYGGQGEITGGVLIAVGAGGMAQNLGESSTQGLILVNITPAQAGSGVTLADSEGNILVSFTPEKSYSSVVVSCPEIQAGKTYTLTTGEEITSIEMTSLIYGSGGMAGGKGGGMGKGTAPDGMEDGGRIPPDGMGGKGTPPNGMEGEWGTGRGERPAGGNMPEEIPDLPGADA